jgi:hypothetical protein
MGQDAHRCGLGDDLRLRRLPRSGHRSRAARLLPLATSCAQAPAGARLCTRADQAKPVRNLLITSALWPLLTQQKMRPMEFPTMSILTLAANLNAEVVLSWLIWAGIRAAALVAGMAFVVWFAGCEVARLVRVCREVKGRIVDSFRQ